jgi:uncharacterized membrane protein (UPF0127 family)
LSLKIIGLLTPPLSSFGGGEGEKQRWGQVAPAIHYVRSLIENSGGIRQPVGVNLKRILLSLLVVTLLVGCEKTETSPPLSLEDSLPTQAQPKLPTMKIYLGAEALDAELALTEQQVRTGMMFRTNIPETDSMLFVLPYPQRANFWMKNCPESLSAAYITPDGTIQEIHHLEKNDTNGVVAARDDIQFVLETKDGWFQRHNISTGTVIRTEKGSLAETFFSNRQ